MADVSRTTEAEDLDSSEGEVEAELSSDGDLGGGDAAAGNETSLIETRGRRLETSRTGRSRWTRSDKP
jgi:hypothetical protein